MTYMFEGCFMVKKSLSLLGLLLLTTLVAWQNSHAVVNNMAAGMANDMKQCVSSNINSTFNRSLNSIARYTNGIYRTSKDIADGKVAINSLKNLGNAITSIQSDYKNITTGVINPLEKAYGSVNDSMLTNMAAFNVMTEVMRNKRSATVYFYNAGKKTAVKVGVGKVTDDVFKALDSIPTVSEMNGALTAINSANPVAVSAAKSSKSQSDNALDSVKKVEKALSLALGDDVNINALINDIDALKQAEKVLNMDKGKLPPSVSTVANIASMKPALDAFMLLNNVERIKRLQEFVTTLQSFKKLQALQDGAILSLTAATEISKNITKLSNVLSALSADGASVKGVLNTAKDAKKTFKVVKGQVADIKKMAAELNKAATDIKNLGNLFKQDIAKIERTFSGSANLADLLASLGAFKGLKPTVDSVVDYMDISKKALDLQNTVMGFGKDANSTALVMNKAKPYVDDAKVEVKAWGNDIKNYFGKADADSSKVNATDRKIAEKERTANKLKQGYKDYKIKRAKAQANLNYLETVYKSDAAALAKIKKAKDRLSKIASSTQISKLATDTLGVTAASRDVINAYKSITRLDENRLMRPIDRFKNQLDKFADVENQLRDVKDLAKKIQYAKQVVNGIANNIQALGGIIKCFDINLDAVLRDLLYRVQDYLVGELKQGVWAAYSEAIINLPYLMLPDDSSNHYKSPWSFLEEKETPLPLKSDLEKLAGIKPEAPQHPHAGLQFAGITFPKATTVDDLKHSKTVTPDVKKMSNDLDYSDAMSAWDVSIAPTPKINAGVGIEWDFGDWSTTAWMPIVGSTKCGFDLTDDFCWYWQWNSCLFISKCYKTPVLLPACMTNFDYKEPTVHVEVSPRAATSQLLYMEFLKDIPSDIDDWNFGGKEPVPSVHVTGISPMARKLSNLNVMGGNLTMTCDIAKKLDKFEYIQFYGLPTSPAKIAMTIGSSLVDLKDWKKEWFTEEAAELGKFPASLQALYLSELNKGEWSPRTFPDGKTPSGETKTDYDKKREESYQWALPYLDDGTATSGTTVVENIMMNKCDAGLTPPADENVCVGKWGALYPRNGQVATEDMRFPMKHLAQLAYRAYDRTLEKGLIKPLKVQPGTEEYGVGYDKTEFSLDWPYRTDRMQIGEDPRTWMKGYYGEEFNNGGMVMTMWKDTSCCVKACCDYSMIGYYPGETYYWDLSGLLGFEGEKWKITDVTKHK